MAYLFADGTTDIGFGNPGELGTSTFAFGLPGETASPVGLAVMPDGRVVVAAQAQTAANSAVDFGVARFALNSPATLTANQQYVRSLYHTDLGRDGSLAEINFHVGELASMGRYGVAREIFTSAESQTRVVNSLYLAVPRPPRRFGRAGLVHRVDPGRRDGRVGRGLAGGVAGVRHAPDVEHRHRLRDLAVPEHPASAGVASAEVSFYVGLIPNLGRLGVASAFFASTEYRGIAVTADYATYLLRTTPRRPRRSPSTPTPRSPWGRSPSSSHPRMNITHASRPRRDVGPGGPPRSGSPPCVGSRSRRRRRAPSRFLTACLHARYRNRLEST